MVIHPHHDTRISPHSTCDRRSKIDRRLFCVLPGLRSLSLDSYLILYTVSDQCVEILRVVSGYRDLQDLFDDSGD